MKMFYKEWNPRQGSIDLVDQANEIIEEYELDDYTLTLRQLYYQFVARDIIENSERSYKNLGNVITNARMAGMVSWEAIEDRNRQHKSFWYDEDIMHPIRDLPLYIRFDRWARQDHYIEVWVEKEALGNVISRACDSYYVPHLSCKGYLSASEAWRAGRRFQEKLYEGKQCHIIHLGDHDPSGIDMTRDNDERVNLFAEVPKGVHVTRLALNMDQVEKYNPPPNPTKISDSRAKDYIRKYGRTSWELDALEPQVMEKMIQDEFKQYINFSNWNDVINKQEIERTKLQNIYDKWDLIEPLISGMEL